MPCRKALTGQPAALLPRARPGPVGGLDPTSRNVANPPTTEEIIEHDLYGLRVVFDERLQRGRERRICRWSADVFKTCQ
jgi:hypothetical protein